MFIKLDLFKFANIYSYKLSCDEMSLIFYNLILNL